MPGMSQWLPRRHVRAAGVAACLVLVVASVVLAAAGQDDGSFSPVLAGPPTDKRAAPSVSQPEARDVDAEQAPAAGGVTRTSEPDAYAQSVGAVVLGVDTRTSTPEALRERLRGEADPRLSDDGLADLHATIDARVPADALWERMRSNGQWSQWKPTRTWEPATWAQVVTQGLAEPGWVMRNVTGVQTTHYVEDGMDRSSSREATLSVVMRCPVDGVDLPSCRLVLISTQPVF